MKSLNKNIAAYQFKDHVNRSTGEVFTREVHAGQWPLLQFLESTRSPRPENLKTIKQVRQAAADGDDAKKRELKKSLPAITPGACIPAGTRRKKDSITPDMVTGWMQFDVDGIADPAATREQLKSIPYIAYAGLSASGAGLWGLVRVADKNRYKDHFQQLFRDFLSIGITLDSSKGANPHDLRFWSHDPDAHINHDFKIYDRVPVPEKATRTNRRTTVTPSTSDQETLMEAVQIIQSRAIDITSDYANWVALGMAIANIAGEQGREIYHQISQYYGDYSPAETNKKYDSLLRSRSTAGIGTILHICREHGIIIKEAKQQING